MRQRRRPAGASSASPGDERATDERGSFARTFCAEEFARHGLAATVAQCNLSSNRRRGTLRGLHWQASPHAEAKLVRQTVRASSVAENLNRRLSCYFFLRRELGPDYLSLLQFFLNHRRLERSAHAERVGQSPAELLTGQEHPHWLELLGYQRFKRA